MDYEDLLQRYKAIFPQIDVAQLKADDSNFVLSYVHYLTHYIDQYTQLAQMASSISFQNSESSESEISFVKNIIAPLKDNATFNVLQEKEELITESNGKSEQVFANHLEQLAEILKSYLICINDYRALRQKLHTNQESLQHKTFRFNQLPKEEQEKQRDLLNKAKSQTQFMHEFLEFCTVMIKSVYVPQIQVTQNRWYVCGVQNIEQQQEKNLSLRLDYWTELKKQCEDYRESSSQKESMEDNVAEVTM